MNENVIKNLKKRNEEIKNGKSSNIVTGLVVQGGAMRGIYSMAVLMGLEEMGFSNAFDHIVGSSAGAINSAYFLAEQSTVAVSIYLDDLSDNRFIDFRRLKKIVDIDYMVDDVVKKTKLLNAVKVRKAFTKLHTALTDYQTGESFFITNKDENVDIYEAIRATAAMPILYNRKVQIKDRYYVDGGIADGTPLFKAIDLGCTDLIVVLTRKPNFRRKAPNLIMRILEEPFLKEFPIKLRKKITSEDKYFNKTMEYIELHEKKNSQVRILTIFPSNLNKLVSRTTKSRIKLLSCALMGRNDVRRSFGELELNDNPYN